MGVHSRGSIKSDIPEEIQTGDPPEVIAIESYREGVYRLTMVAPIPAGQFRTAYLYLPPGIIYQVKALTMLAYLIGAGIGNVHSLSVHMSNNIDILLGTSAWNADIGFNYGHWNPASVIQEPGQEFSQILALNSLVGTSDEAIYFKYSNNTLGAQPQDITINIITREGAEWV